MERYSEINKKIDEKLKKGHFKEIADLVIAVGIILLLVLFIWIDLDINSNLYVAIVFMILALLLIWEYGTEYLQQKERDKISGELGEYVVHTVFPDAEYSLKGHLSKELIKSDMGFQIEYKKIENRDQIKVNYRGEDFHISVVDYLKKQRRTPGTKILISPYASVFKGPWIILDMGRSFYGEVFITSRTMETQRLQTYMAEVENEEFNEVLGIGVQDERDFEIFANKMVTDLFLRIIKDADGEIYVKFLKNGMMYFYSNNAHNLFKFKEYGPTADELRRGYEYELEIIKKLMDDLVTLKKFL